MAYAELDTVRGGEMLHVLHDNPVWFETFRAELTRRGLAWREWLVGGDEAGEAALGAIDFAAAPPEGVYFNRTSASSHTRGKAHAMEMGSVVVQWLESHGRRVLGGSRAMALEMSKARQEAAFRRHRVRTPQTHILFCTTADRRPREAAVDAALSRFDASTRVVVKPSRGGSGAGVRIFESPAAARAHLLGDSFDPAESIDSIYLVQEFIESPEKCLWRMEFVGGQLVYGVRVDTADILSSADAVRNCPADSCEAKRGAATAAAAAPASAAADVWALPEAAAPTFSFDAVGVGATTFGADAPTPKFDLAAAGLGGSSAGACPFTIAASKFVVTPGFDDELVGALSSLLVAEGVDVCGVEVVRDAAGRSYVIDMNTVNSNYNSRAERKAGLGVQKKKRKGASAASKGRTGAQAVVDLMLAELERDYGAAGVAAAYAQTAEADAGAAAVVVEAAPAVAAVASASVGEAEAERAAVSVVLAAADAAASSPPSPSPSPVAVEPAVGAADASAADADAGAMSSDDDDATARPFSSAASVPSASSDSEGDADSDGAREPSVVVAKRRRSTSRSLVPRLDAAALAAAATGLAR